MKNIRLVLWVVGLWILSLAGVALYVWLERGREKDDEWRARIEQNRPPATTTTTFREIPQPPDSGRSTARPAKPTAPVVTKSDSTTHYRTIAALIRLERDSLEAALRDLLNPQQGEALGTTLGRLDYVYHPLERVLEWVHHPPPMPWRIDSVAVPYPVLTPRPWWEAPLYVAGGALAGAAAVLTLR